MILLYMPTFATTQLGLPLGEAFTAQSIGVACLITAVPLFGAVSDRVGRKPIMIGAYTPYLGLAYPLFVWVQLTRISHTIVARSIGSADDFLAWQALARHRGAGRGARSWDFSRAAGAAKA